MTGFMKEKNTVLRKKLMGKAPWSVAYPARQTARHQGLQLSAKQRQANPGPQRAYDLDEKNLE